MGKKLDALLGKNFKTSKFTSLVNLAIARLAVFKTQRQVRCKQARSDVVQLLEQGLHERALFRVEHVIKEQNMLDVYVMIEGHCNLLVERAYLIEQERECPEELKETVATLLYGSTRCGDFPELQEIRAVLTSRYGREFAARVMELRNNCGVNHTIIQKLSTRQPNLESRMEILKEIASDNNVVLQLGEAFASTMELETNKVQNQPMPQVSTNLASSKLDGHSVIPLDNSGKDGVSNSIKLTQYKDVADAAQAAFESAAYAAAAARAAVELSRDNYHDPDDQKSPKIVARKSSLTIDPVDHIRSESKEVPYEKEMAKLKDKGLAESSMRASNSSSGEGDLKVNVVSNDAEEIVRNVERDIVLDEHSNEDHDLDSNSKQDKLKDSHKN